MSLSRWPLLRPAPKQSLLAELSNESAGGFRKGLHCHLHRSVSVAIEWLVAELKEFTSAAIAFCLHRSALLLLVADLSVVTCYNRIDVSE